MTEAMNLPVMPCCATCESARGWIDNAWCARHMIAILSYTKCDDYARNASLPVWVICQPIEPIVDRRK